MRKIHKYQIAELLLGIEAEDKYLHPELADFEISSSEEPQIWIHLIKDVPAGTDHGTLLIQSELIYIYENTDSYHIIYQSPLSSVYGCLLKKDSKQATVYIKDEVLNHGIEIMYSIRDTFFFYMQQYQRIAIHSASILYHDHVWLFSAPSGTGKSTHVNLWRKAGFSFRDFNGDVAVCYLSPEGLPLAAGLPWCGTSNIYQNEISPLGGVIFLRQGQHNTIQTSAPLEGVIQLTARCLTPSWNHDMMSKNLQICQAMAGKIVLGNLCCTPDITAAQMSQKFIDENIL